MGLGMSINYLYCTLLRVLCMLESTLEFEAIYYRDARKPIKEKVWE